MSQPDASLETPYQPRWAGELALLIFVMAMLALCAPMLGGQFLLGDDQYNAGFAFRQFGAEWFRSHGALPQWNPYLFGGMPFIAAMHGDIFYPTAWLRWILPVDTAMNLGFAIHLVLAGAFMYLLLRGLRLGWTAAVVGGVAYQLSGIVASQVSPGHDGKLFVSALAPLAFFALLRAVRDRQAWGYGLFALVVGLTLVSPHFQMTYYLLVALGIWTLYLVFGDPGRPAGRRWPVPLALALGAILLGLGIAAIQILPFTSYIPWSPRAAGQASATWEYATSWSLAPEEVVTAILPQFNGVLEAYWGRNFFKSHTEYLGVMVLLPAVFAFGDRARRRLCWALVAVGGLFLLVSLGGHTPFYRLWYEVMPMMKKVRAAGMAWYLVALPAVILAGIGLDRILRREVAWRPVAIAAGALAGFALLGAVGFLQTVAEAFVQPEQVGRLAANADHLRGGALRLLLFVILAGGALWAVRSGLARGAVAAGALILVAGADLWSVDRQFFRYQPPAAETFRDDSLTAYLRAEKPPFRVYDPAGIYPGSWLMAHDIASVLGYHGNQIRFYDVLLGGKLEQWPNQFRPDLWDLLAVRYIILPQEQPVPGYHKVLGPVLTTPGKEAVLYRQDSLAPWAWVVGAAARVPEEQLVPTVLDPRFPARLAVVYPDTASVNPAPLGNNFIPPAPVTAELTAWAAGDMTIRLAGQSDRETYLVVGESWYPDWHATVDGTPVPLLRGDYALLSVALPPGAREVRFQFRGTAFPRGKWVTAVSLLLTTLLIAVPLARRRRDLGV